MSWILPLEHDELLVDYRVGCEQNAAPSSATSDCCPEAWAESNLMVVIALAEWVPR